MGSSSRIRFWVGSFTDCFRFFPTQAFNLAFKDTFKRMFPKYNPKTEFGKIFGANLVSGGIAVASSLCIVYSIDYARARLASDVSSGKKSFSGQMQSEKPPEEHLYKGTGDCFKALREVWGSGAVPTRGADGSA